MLRDTKKRGKSFIGKALFMVFTVCAFFMCHAELGADELHAGTRDLTGKSVAVLVGEGVHDGETLFPIGFLENRGAQVTVLGTGAGEVKAYNSDTWIKVKMSVDDADIEQFDAIIIPGGRSPSYLREHENVVEFARRGVEMQKVTAAICHGPQLLIAAGVLQNRYATAFPNVKEELEDAGARYEDVPMMRDGNIITSRIPDDLPDFMRAVEKALLERE